MCEVVAEAMTDVMPESSFIRSIYEKSPSLGNRIRKAFRKFLARIKTYFSSLVNNPLPEARAIKVNENGIVKYSEDVMSAWDAMAEASVANRKAAFERQGGEVEAESGGTVQKRIREEYTDTKRRIKSTFLCL